LPRLSGFWVDGDNEPLFFEEMCYELLKEHAAFPGVLHSVEFVEFSLESH
jgi:hypothetical protein